MSCDRRCFDVADKHFGHEDCSTCPGRDDGTPTAAKMQGTTMKTNNQTNEQPAPYANCKFQICDLPGQCKGEGRCHHPATLSYQDKMREGQEQPADDRAELIRHMANRFLAWKLPKEFHPDNFISFDRDKHDTWGGYPNSWPSGTNLFDYEQVKEMLEYLLDGYAPHQTGCISNCDSCINAHGSPAHAGFCRAFYDEPNGVCPKWADAQRPAMKPLTDEQQNTRLRQVQGYGDYAGGFYDGVKFAEAHHGIKER